MGVMKALVIFYLLPFTFLATLGCQGPQVFVLHAPIQPSNAQPVTYTSSAEAPDARGNRDADGWVYYAAGTFPWPDLPIPVYTTGPPSQRLDVTLIPDAGY